MPETSFQPNAELTEKDKVISLFRFIQELNKLKQKSILNIRDYHKVFMLSNLHEDPDNIKIYYRDRVENEDEETGTTLLSVRKPEFQTCPAPDALLKEWLVAGWDNFRNEVRVKEVLERKEPSPQVVRSLFDESVDDETTPEPEHFDDDKRRVNAYNAWLQKRNRWVEKQKILDKTRDLYGELYQYYFELKKESETKELIVANGMLYDSGNSEIVHPVLTHRVKLQLDPDKNIVSIEDTGMPTELYSVIFQMMDDINLSAVNQMNADLQKNDYHPLDRNDTPGFLKVLVRQLSSDSLFSAGGVPENWKQNNRLLLTMEPCYIVRNRLDGTLKAIEQIIENIQETDEIPAPICDIVSGGTIEIPEDTGEESVEEQLAAVGGESVEILLSKEANKEQLEIAKRIEHYNAVLVQGPPGTGKTHTIANLMGHFLAQGKSVLVTSYTTKALSVLKEKVAPGLQNLCVSMLDDSNVDMEKSVDGITDYMSKSTASELKRDMDMLAAERKDIIDKLAGVRRNIFAIIHQECNCIVLNGEDISPSKAAEFVCSHVEDLSYIPGSIRLRAPLPLTFAQLQDLYRSNEGISESDEAELKCEIPAPESLLSPADFTEKWKSLQSAIQRSAEIASDKNWKLLHNPENRRIQLRGAFGEFTMPYPAESGISKLKRFATSLGSIEKWMKCAAVDGKNGGAYRQRWDMLVSQIEETCAFAESIVTEQFGRTIRFETEDIFSLQDVYERMRATFEEKGKLGKFTLLTHKDYEPALKLTSIDGKPVSSAAECTIILNKIALKKLRMQCAVFWNELLAPNGVPAFEDLDERTPENIAANWIPMIHRYLDWYATDYQPLIALLAENQIPADAVLERNALDSDLIATGKMLNAVENTIPYICDICEAVLKEQAMTAAIGETKRVLTIGKRGSSTACRSLLAAAEKGDSTAYAEAYAALEVLYGKYDLQAKRKELLAILEPYAPQWAEAIRARTGVHGKSVVPADIEDAWKWKQLSGIIEEITAKPFAEMQAESLRLSREYRKTTANYAEKCAWYHLLRRTETNLHMKQALQGWKQTVKRIGKGTGKQAPMYKAKARELMPKCQSAVPGWIMPINKALESLNPKLNRFDIIIIDEASQSDISSLAILYMGKKLIIVGDDKQVSPMAVGVEAGKMSALEQMYLEGKIPNSHLYNAKTSIYDVAATTFQPLMLREHFRCVPEIIGFSNMLSYDYKIKPLRDASNSVLLPAVVNYRVENGLRTGKTNQEEAKTIVALMRACMEQPEYAGKSFGVISLLGDDQAKIIQQQIEKQIEPREIESRSILCGNSANFQGDERDVIFLSMVDSGNGNGPLHLLENGADDATRKRYNVAASRARDQLWVVNSLDPASDLKPNDIRKKLIDYSLDPQAAEIKHGKVTERAESPFEAAVATALVDRGYHLEQQWQVGAYRLDIVAVCGKKMVAIECDGERWHSGEAKIREDMERQTILERLGWRFIRIRGSEYFRNPEQGMNRVVKELTEYGIEPEETEVTAPESRNTELLQRVKKCAGIILYGEGNAPQEPTEVTIETALGSETSTPTNEPPQIVVVEPISTPAPVIEEPRKQKPESTSSAENKNPVTYPSGNGEATVLTVKTPVSPLQPSEGDEDKTKEAEGKKVETKEAETKGANSEKAKTQVDLPPKNTNKPPKVEKPKEPETPSQQPNDGQQVIRGMEELIPEADDIITLLKKNNVEYIDKRSTNGALWIIGGSELKPIVAKARALGIHFNFKAGGGKQSKGRDAWWGK